MQAAAVQVDDFLRGIGSFATRAASAPSRWSLPAMIIVFGCTYGALMGSYHLDAPERFRQVLYSATKMPLLLLATSALCLPGFFVLNTVLGLRDDFVDALRAILAGQAALSIALASLGPLTVFWYISSDNYRAALLFNAVVFTVATLAGQFVMLRYYRELIRRHAAHRITLLAWLALYAFVGIQMAWMLRPFVGAPSMPTTFFRQEPFSNAYIVVTELVFN